LLEVAVFIEDFQYIKEGKMDNFINKMYLLLPKVGLKLSKKDSFFKLLSRSYKHLTSLFYHSFIAYYNNDDKHREETRKLLKRIKKEEIMDFLLRLDILTLHIITGPIHIIEALTGWKLSANLNTVGKEIEYKVKQAIIHLEELAKSVGEDIKKKIVKYINALRRMFDVGRFVKVGRDI